MQLCLCLIVNRSYITIECPVTVLKPHVNPHSGFCNYRVLLNSLLLISVL